MDDRVFELLCRWDEATPKPPLEVLCRDAPDLLGELRQLVSAVQRADGQLQKQSSRQQEVTQESRSRRVTVKAGLRLPQIEGYQILEQLGEGGMGVVWLAIQLSTKRRVALKLMSAAAFGSDRARKRFEREVELAARLDHPHIARVYDSGEDRGVLYYAMELVNGTRLDTYCQDQRLSQRQTAELMLLICRAIEHAHQRGIIHRDLKPSNIMISRNGEPRVLDFGLARDIEGGPAISIEGDVAGTPAYMSPEQARGQSGKVDTRSDVYTLGTILHKLLTGENPHDVSGSAMAVMSRIAGGQFKSPRSVRPDMDGELEAIILKAMSFAPEDRYGSAGAMADDLARYLRSEPLSARAPTLLYFAGRHIRRHRKLVVSASLVSAVLIAGAIGWVYSLDIERRNAIAERNRAQNQRTISDGRSREANEQRVMTLLALEDLVFGVQKEMQRHQGSLQLQHTLLASSLKHLDRLLLNPGDEKAGIERLRAAALLHLGDVEAAGGRDPAASQAYQNALAGYRSCATAEPGHLLAIQNQVVALIRHGRLLASKDASAAKASLVEALKLLESVPSDVEMRSHRRAAMMVLGDLVMDAAPADSQAFYAQAAALEPTPLESAMLLRRRAMAHLAENPANHQRALELTNQGMTIARGLVASNATSIPGRRELAATLACQGQAHLKAGSPEQAMAGLSESLGIWEGLITAAPDHADAKLEWAATVLLQAEAHRARGEIDAGASLRGKALDQLTGFRESWKAAKLVREATSEKL